MNAPKKINLGSGRRFLEDHINIDLNDAWKPDIVTDVASPGAIGETPHYSTERFGSLALKRNHFELITASHVLEHVPDLVSTMTACRDLLAMGGQMHIEVPYELSYGAWQDPTHVRALNERSWLYYTDWFWMSGWSETRFLLRELRLHYSQLGHQLAHSGVDAQQIFRTPRAVDVMSVVLEKIALTPTDIETLARETPPRDLKRSRSS
jgi:hypothetical protein